MSSVPYTSHTHIHIHPVKEATNYKHVTNYFAHMTTTLKFRQECLQYHLQKGDNKIWKIIQNYWSAERNYIMDGIRVTNAFVILTKEPYCQH